MVCLGCVCTYRNEALNYFRETFFEKKGVVEAFDTKIAVSKRLWLIEVVDVRSRCADNVRCTMCSRQVALGGMLFKQERLVA